MKKRKLIRTFSIPSVANGGPVDEVIADLSNSLLELIREIKQAEQVAMTKGYVSIEITEAGEHSGETWLELRGHRFSQKKTKQEEPKQQLTQSAITGFKTGATLVKGRLIYNK